MYIVTGGAGFIGSAIVWRLNQAGIDNILIVDNLGVSEKWKNLVNRKFKDYIHKTKFIDKLNDNSFGHIEAIIHMGACSSTTERNADYLMHNNFHYSVKLSEYALNNDIPFIYASSAATYGDGTLGFSDENAILEKLKPLNMYGYSKQLFDLWGMKSGALRKSVGLKFFNVFGPNEFHKGDMCSVIFKAFHQINETGKLRLFKSYKQEFEHGEQRRDFVYVKDCANLIWWLLEKPDIKGIFNVGFGKERTWNDLAKATFSAMQVQEKIEFIDMPEQLREKYQYFTCADMSKLYSKGCEIEFMDLEKSIQDYVTNYLLKEDQYL